MSRLRPVAAADVDRHRQYPRPRRPWVMRQTWRDLLFAHWPLPADALRDVVPQELTIDTYDGRAWVGVVPFRARGTRLRLLPPIPTATTFPELNVRTYVTLDGRPGIHFLSLDAASRLAVEAARLIPLPYLHARMTKTLDARRWVAFSSTRIDPRGRPGELRARYRPIDRSMESAPGSIASWLTDRFCLYTVHPSAGVLRIDIDHDPWSLQPAEAELPVNTMTEAAGIALPDVQPLLHFARRVDAFFWAPVAGS